MSDLISKSALYKKIAELEDLARKRLLNAPVDTEDKAIEYIGLTRILNERTTFKHLISDAPTIEPYGTWIPCSERLPKKGSYIKVWMSFSNHVSSYTKIAHWADDKFVWDNGREIKDKPDAWMPFFAPEPYREEKKDE